MLCIKKNISHDTSILVIEKPDYIKRVSEEKVISVKKVGDRVITVVYVEKEKHIKVVTVY